MLSSLYLAFALTAALVTSAASSSWAKTLPFTELLKNENRQVEEIRQLDEVSLRKNSLVRLVREIRNQTPDAQGLDKLTVESMVVKKSIPIKAGPLSLWMVKMLFKNPEPESEQNFGDLEMVMLVDHTGVYQFPEIYTIANGESQTETARREMYTVEVKDDLGDFVMKGKGDKNVVFISDNFCPFCKQAYSFLTQNLQNIAELKIVHMPMPGLHPTATIASMVMAYAKDILAPDKFSDLVTFAYSDLEPGERVLKGRERDAESPISAGELREMEMDVVKQYLSKFPELAKGLDVNALYTFIRDNFAKRVEKEAQEIAKKFKISGTPATMIDGYLIRGFNRLEIKKSLEANK